jgi:hypothetical protein
VPLASARAVTSSEDFAVRAARQSSETDVTARLTAIAALRAYLFFTAMASAYEKTIQASDVCLIARFRAV